MKIAIINNWPHQYMGGIETYSKRLIEMFISKGWKVDEYSTLSALKGVANDKPIKGVKQIDISNGASFYRKHAHKVFNQLITSDKYDLIVNNSLTTRKSLNSDKVISIQHMERRFYSLKSPDRWFNILNSIFLGIGSPKSILSHKNVVYFTKYENPKSLGNPLYTPTPLKNSFKIKKKNKIGESIFWLGRHEEPHKGLKHLLKMFKHSLLRKYLVIGGDGPNTNILDELSDMKIGTLSSERVEKEFSKSKIFILTSNTEGFPLVVVEALASGVPVVMFESFLSAKFFRETNSVKLVKNLDEKKFMEKVSEIINMEPSKYKVLSKEATKFAKDNFRKSDFDRKWIDYVLKVKGRL